MMRISLVFISTIFLVLSVSCNKCQVCEYTDDFGQLTTSSESCGSKKKQKAFEDNLIEQWGAFGPVECIDQ